MGLLSWLIPPRLSLQPGLAASDLHPSSPRTSSRTKPSPRQRGKRNPPNAMRSIWSVLCSLCPLGDRQPDLGHSAAPPLPPSPHDTSFWAVFLPFREKIVRAGGGQLATPISQPLRVLQAGFEAQHFSAVDFCLELRMHSGALCSAEGIAKVCFEEAEKGFPQTNYRQVLN